MVLLVRVLVLLLLQRQPVHHGPAIRRRGGRRRRPSRRCVLSRRLAPVDATGRPIGVERLGEGGGDCGRHGWLQLQRAGGGRVA